MSKTWSECLKLPRKAGGGDWQERQDSNHVDHPGFGDGERYWLKH